MKKVFCIVLALLMVLSMVSFAGAETLEEIIAQAQTMTNEELYKKAIEEANGKSLLGIGNSSRGKTAKDLFIPLLKEMDPNFDTTIEWTQPKNNTIFEALKGSNEYFVTLIQDGNQIQSKMLNTGELLNFVPYEWANAEGVARENNENPLALQTLNKVFEFNNVGKLLL